MQNGPGAYNDNVHQPQTNINSHRNSSVDEHGTRNAPLGSMGTLGEALPLSDRPHTISSAYEKAGPQHQRPLLQPYTFNAPESTMTIPETCELSSSEHNESIRSQKITNISQQQRRSINDSHDSLPPPPPPPKPPKIANSLLSRPGLLCI